MTFQGALALTGVALLLVALTIAAAGEGSRRRGRRVCWWVFGSGVAALVASAWWQAVVER